MSNDLNNPSHVTSFGSDPWGSDYRAEIEIERPGGKVEIEYLVFTDEHLNDLRELVNKIKADLK